MYVCVYVYVCECVCVYVYAFLCVCVCVCMCVCLLPSPAVIQAGYYPKTAPPGTEAVSLKETSLGKVKSKNKQFSYPLTTTIIK